MPTRRPRRKSTPKPKAAPKAEPKQEEPKPQAAPQEQPKAPEPKAAPMKCAECKCSNVDWDHYKQELGKATNYGKMKQLVKELLEQLG